MYRVHNSSQQPNARSRGHSKTHSLVRIEDERPRPRPFILVIVSASKPALQACEKRRRFSSYSVFFFVQMCNARAENNPSAGSTCPRITRLSCSACCMSDHVCHKQQPKAPASESTHSHWRGQGATHVSASPSLTATKSLATWASSMVATSEVCAGLCTVTLSPRVLVVVLAGDALPLGGLAPHYIFVRQSTAADSVSAEARTQGDDEDDRIHLPTINVSICAAI